jgi:hypothetical protein
MPEQTIFDRAIAAHAMWKYRLFQAIKAGKSDATVTDAAAVDRCDFGKWLQSLPPSECQSDRCKKVRSLHTEFHKNAAEVLELALRGRSEEAKSAIALGSRFSSVSAELTMALSEWKEAAGPLTSDKG